MTTDNQNGNGDTDSEPTMEQVQERFNTLMDGWVQKQREKEEEEEKAPKRTQKPRSVWTDLFGG